MSLINIFIEEANEGVEQWEKLCLRLESSADAATDIGVLFRIAHNLKGSAMTVGLDHLGHYLHSVEELLTALKGGKLAKSAEIVGVLLNVQTILQQWVGALDTEPSFKHPDAAASTAEIEAALRGEAMPPALAGPPVAANAAEAAPTAHPASPAEVVQEVKQAIASAQNGKDAVSIRVALQKLDTLLNLLGELVVDQAMMNRHRMMHTTASTMALRTISHMGKTIHEIQAIVMALRMVALDSTFQKLTRTARTVAQQLGKKIDIHLEGGDVELDKVIVDRLGEPLVHMVRNALDHGGELPADRVNAGKAEAITLVIGAKQMNDQVEIKIQDDGRGMDPEVLTRKAVEKGLLPANAKLTPEEAFALIFRAGFSTKTEVSEVSGRGIGMDVVAAAIHDLKGSIKIGSVKGQGTTFTLLLPLSLSIIEGLVVSVQEHKYVIPLTQLIETIDIRSVSLETARGKGRVINLRGDVVPLLGLHSLLRVNHRPHSAADDLTAKLCLVANCRGKKIGFAVDSIVGQQSVVLKPFPKQFDRLPGVVGGAVLSDGEPALVLSLGDFRGIWSAAHAA